MKRTPFVAGALMAALTLVASAALFVPLLDAQDPANNPSDPNGTKGESTFGNPHRSASSPTQFGGFPATTVQSPDSMDSLEKQISQLRKSSERMDQYSQQVAQELGSLTGTNEKESKKNRDTIKKAVADAFDAQRKLHLAELELFRKRIEIARTKAQSTARKS